MTTTVDKGDILLNGKPYRVDLSTYKVTDIVDFAPRAASPGGSIIHSELGLYQPLLQTDWRHGFGFAWYQDASGYMRTDGSLDTRHPGIIMLMTAAVQSDNDNFIKRGYTTFNGVLYSWGNGGIRKFNGSTWSAMTYALPGTVQKTASSATLVGTGTNWLTTLAVGDSITVPGTANETKIIATVVSNTSCTTTTNFANNASGQTMTFNMSNSVNSVLSTGQYLFILQDTYRIKKMTTGEAFSNAGLDANATDYKWGVIFGGYMWFGKDSTSRVHFSDQEDLNDLEGTTSDADVIYAGAGSYATLSARVYAGKMYVLRPDGIWLLENKIPTRVLNFDDQTSALNFRSTAEFNGLLTFPIRDRIKQWNGSRLTDQTPPQWSDQFPYGTYGRFNNFVTVGDFLYCTARDNLASYSEDLLCWDGVGWSKLARLISSVSSGEISAMGYDVVNNRLWYHYDHASADNTYYISFQDQSDYPYANFSTSGTHSWISSRLDMGFRRVTKSVRSMLVEASGIVSAHQALTIYYSLDGAAWVSWGTITANGVTDLVTPGGNNSIQFYYMQLRVDFTTDNASLSPILEGLTLRFIMRPQVAYGHAMTILRSDQLQYGTMKDDRSASDIRADLRTVRASAAPVAFVDPYGDSHSVYISALIDNLLEQNVGENPDGSSSFEAVAHVNVVEV